MSSYNSGLGDVARQVRINWITWLKNNTICQLTENLTPLV